jgi:hypothetical protein
MRTYKFLRDGAIAPFTGVRWPQPCGDQPGEWLDAGDVEPCRRGIHACRLDDLPYWFQDELWEIELEDDVQRIGHKLAARRGRLVRRIDAWDSESAHAFALACAERATALAVESPEVAGHAADAAVHAGAGKAAVTGYIVSRAAELAGGVDGYDKERAAQVEWLAGRLGLARD